VHRPRDQAFRPASDRLCGAVAGFLDCQQLASAGARHQVRSLADAQRFGHPAEALQDRVEGLKAELTAAQGQAETAEELRRELNIIGSKSSSYHDAGISISSVSCPRCSGTIQSKSFSSWGDPTSPAKSPREISGESSPP
jgi:hypothetical protein